MKAKETARKTLELLKDKKVEEANNIGIDFMAFLLTELARLATERKPKCNSAMLAIFKEVVNRWDSYVKRINSGLGFTFYRDGGFQEAIKERSPELYELIGLLEINTKFSERKLF